MESSYKIEEFDLEKLFSIFSFKYEFEDGSVGEDISCGDLESLKKRGNVVICCVEIFSSGFLLDDYYMFSENSEDNLWGNGGWESFVDENGEDEKARILKIADEKGWKPDGDLAMAINGDGVGVAVKVSLNENVINLEKGFVGGGSEKSSPTFWETFDYGMPEVSKLINDTIKSCINR